MMQLGDTPFDAFVSTKGLPAVLSAALRSARTNDTADKAFWESFLVTLKHQDAVTAVQLCLQVWWRQKDDGTELTEPPDEVLVQGAMSVQTYITALTASSSPTYRHKVCVVGPTTWGKTSLIKSLTRKKVTLEKIDRRTVGIDLFGYEFGATGASGDTEKHEVMFWDFAGQDVYHAAHSVFFSKRTVFLMAIDLPAYAARLPEPNERCHPSEPRIRAFVDECILYWVCLILTRQPDATIVFIGTKRDLVTDELIVGDIQSDLERRVRTWCQEQEDRGTSTSRDLMTWSKRQQLLTSATYPTTMLATSAELHEYGWEYEVSALYLPPTLFEQVIVHEAQFLWTLADTTGKPASRTVATIRGQPGQVILRMDAIPAMPVLRRFVLQLCVQKLTVFRRKTVATGSWALDQVIPEASYSLLQPSTVMIDVVSPASKNDVIGRVKCLLSCSPNEERANAA
ncbi:hypothetical protein P43SY_009941 [Pythium insidiosum]|uniref:Uncharacterized protein n=1 Tax=Pythium insidiosum TaxID=114742 RepID=A0AAD5Q7J9_PYTIN|nr:hypothetical protein P43SY_009941 [Pythium insidiosum]